MKKKSDIINKAKLNLENKKSKKNKKSKFTFLIKYGTIHLPSGSYNKIKGNREK